MGEEVLLRAAYSWEQSGGFVMPKPKIS